MTIGVDFLPKSNLLPILGTTEVLKEAHTALDPSLNPNTFDHPVETLLPEDETRFSPQVKR